MGSTSGAEINVQECCKFLDRLSQQLKNGNFSSIGKSVEIPNLATLEKALDEIDDDVKTQGKEVNNSSNTNLVSNDHDFIADIGNKIETQFTKV